MIVVALGADDKTYEEMFLRLNKTVPQEDCRQGRLR